MATPTPTTQNLPEPGSVEYADLAQTGSAPPLPAAPGVSLAPVEPDTAEESDALEEPPREPARERTPSAAKSSHPNIRPPAGFPWWPPRPVPLPGIDSGLGLKKFRDRLPQPPIVRAWRRPEDSPIRVRAELAPVRFHADIPPAQAWTYEGGLPGPTIEVRRDRSVRIDWENGLERDGHALPLPYDVVRVPELPPLPPGQPGVNADFRAAALPGGRATDKGPGEDSYPRLAHTAELTAATVVHLHGALTNGHNDGWAHNVALPGGVTRCTYPNRQEATTLWYHDHAMAVTRFNVFAGLSGFYIIRDDQEARLRLPSGDRELFLGIADRNLESEPNAPAGTMKFTGRALYKQAGFTGATGIKGEIPVTAPFTMVNGKVWPTKDVDACWYRLRLLNGSSSRIYRLSVHDTTDEKFTPGTAVPSTDPAFGARRKSNALVVIGTDGGLLPAPFTPQDGIIEMGPGERVDVLVDFSTLRGRTLEVRNENGTALNAQPGQVEASVMQFRVDGRRVFDRFKLPAVLNGDYVRYRHTDDGTLIIGDKVIDHHGHAWVAVVPPGIRGAVHPEMWELRQLEEGEDPGATDVIRLTRADGHVLTFKPAAKLFDDTLTIRFSEGDWAVWNIVHLGGPAHPMHIHMTEFQMLNRWQWGLGPGGALPGFDPATASTPDPLPVPGPGRPITPQTAGMKDTWVVQPGEWVQVLGDFSGATGSFMYHCHILDHEDHTMMRPFTVLPKSIMAFHDVHGGGHH